MLLCQLGARFTNTEMSELPKKSFGFDKILELSKTLNSNIKESHKFQKFRNKIKF